MKQQRNSACGASTFDALVCSKTLPLRSKAEYKSGQPICYKTGQVYLLLTS